MKDRDALWHQDPVQGRLKVGVMAGEREAPPPPPWKPVKGATLKAAPVAAAPGRSGYGRSLCSPPLPPAQGCHWDTQSWKGAGIGHLPWGVEGGPGAAWVLPSGEQAEGPAQEGGGMPCNTHSGTCGRWPL